MSTVIEEIPTEAPRFAAPDDKGQYPADAIERIYAPANLGALLVIEQADGWRGGFEAQLCDAAENQPPTASHLPYRGRIPALLLGCEALISWCGKEKQQGLKKHRRQAEELQGWALNVEKRIQSTEEIANEKPQAAQPAEAAEAPEGEAGSLLGSDRLHTSATDGEARLLAAASGGELKLIPLTDLYESPLNPRQVYPTQAMQELTESMRASGFRASSPLTVSPREESGYWIAAGHRRKRAAEAAGIAEVPCIVQQMTDAQFLDALNFDNSNREDVHPLHEAAGWRHWMEATGKGAVDIAARIGQSLSYVCQRLKYADLSDAGKQAFLDLHITAGHAILIARLSEKEQASALKFCRNEDWRGQRPSVRALAEHLHQEAYVDLKDCPFDRTDKMLVAGAGSCGECPKRAANIPGFEFETDHDGKVRKADLCTDRTCYQQKVDNHLFRIRADLQAKLKAPAGLAAAVVLSVSTDWQKPKKGVYKPSDYERVKAGEKGAQAALVVQGGGVGKVIHVKLKSAPKPQKQPDYEAERKKNEERATGETAIRTKILGAVLEKIAWPFCRADLEMIAAAAMDRDSVPMCEARGIQGVNWQTAPAKLMDAAKSEGDLARLVIEALVFGEAHPTAYNFKTTPEALLALAKRYKVDAVKIRREAEEAAKAADGTRREVTPADTGEGLSAKGKRRAAAAKKALAKKKPLVKPVQKTISAATRKRIAAQQKKRWAEFRRQKAAKAK